MLGIISTAADAINCILVAMVILTTGLPSEKFRNGVQTSERGAWDKRGRPQTREITSGGPFSGAGV